MLRRTSHRHDVRWKDFGRCFYDRAAIPLVDEIRHPPNVVLQIGWCHYCEALSVRVGNNPVEPIVAAFTFNREWERYQLSWIANHERNALLAQNATRGLIYNGLNPPGSRLFSRIRNFPPGWRSKTVVGLAEVIRDLHAFDHLQILGDALEDAGCDNADILDHCRQPSVHRRGCWLVDLILDNE